MPLSRLSCTRAHDPRLKVWTFSHLLAARGLVLSCVARADAPAFNDNVLRVGLTSPFMFLPSVVVWLAATIFGKWLSAEYAVACLSCVFLSVCVWLWFFPPCLCARPCLCFSLAPVVAVCALCVQACIAICVSVCLVIVRMYARSSVRSSFFLCSSCLQLAARSGLHFSASSCKRSRRCGG